MAIWGIIGGIGSGKTLTGTWYLLEDLYQGKKVYTNVALKNVPKALMANVTYLNKEVIGNMFEEIKEGRLDMRNSTIFLQEIHNYIDSRNAMTKKNKALTYWVLQSRHSGEGSCSIMYDTQHMGQVDVRLRKSTDIILRPQVVRWQQLKTKRVPVTVLVQGECFLGQKFTRFRKLLDVTTTRDQYDTHQLVDF